MVDGNAFEDLRKGLIGFVILILMAAQKSAFLSATLDNQTKTQPSKLIVDGAVGRTGRAIVVGVLRQSITDITILSRSIQVFQA